MVPCGVENLILSICDCGELPHSRIKHSLPELAAETTFNTVQLLVSLMQRGRSGFLKGAVYGQSTFKRNHGCFPASVHIKTCCESLF